MSRRHRRLTTQQLLRLARRRWNVLATSSPPPLAAYYRRRIPRAVRRLRAKLRRVRHNPAAYARIKRQLRTALCLLAHGDYRAATHRLCCRLGA